MNNPAGPGARRDAPDRRMLGAWVVVVFLAGLVLATPVHGHGPPEPRDFETRILVDQNDDCGGHGGADNCRGTHDLIGFNVREAFDASLGPVVIFTLLADEGTPSEGVLTDTFTFRASGSTKTVVFETSDDESFQVSGASRVEGPKPLLSGGSPDGTRFTVDAWFERSDLGLGVGDKLQDFRVEAKAGSTRGDVMPGGYISPLTGSETSGSDSSTQYTRPSYTLDGPRQYIRLTPDESVEVVADSTKFVNVRVKNLLSDMAQKVTYSAQAAGVDVGFHDPQSADQESYPNPLDNSIPKGGEEIMHLAVTGREPGTGTIELTLTTDAGGRVTDTVAYTVAARDEDPPDEPAEPADPGEESPAAPALLVLLGALVAARRR